MSKIQPQKCEKTPIVMPLNDGDIKNLTLKVWKLQLWNCLKLKKANFEVKKREKTCKNFNSEIEKNVNFEVTNVKKNFSKKVHFFHNLH